MTVALFILFYSEMMDTKPKIQQKKQFSYKIFK